MKALSATELLAVWEQGAGLPPAERAQMLIEAALPEKSAADLAKLSIGQRDSFLFALRETLFGQEIICLASCPECSEKIEMDFRAADICVEAGTNQEKDEILIFEKSGYTVRFRLPNSSDTVAIANNRDTTAARSELLMRCILFASKNGVEMAVDQLPEDVLESLVDEMAQSDHMAYIQLTLLCPSCGKGWQAVFDIVSFFWSEIDAWAHRTLREIHVLASSYGWSESNILALSPRRREFYLEKVRE